MGLERFEALRRPLALTEPERISAETIQAALRGCPTPPEVIDELLSEADVYRLTEEQQATLRARLSDAIAPGFWAMKARHTDPARTPYGFLGDIDAFEQIKKYAEQAIARCREHRAPNCECWAGARHWLWQARGRYPERSPESWLALQIWNALEQTERQMKE